MDAALPAPLGAPQAEVLEDVLHEQFGPLPQLAAICRLKRRPSGGYSSTEDLQLVLERRRVANAKERERVSGPRLPGPQVPSNLPRPPVLCPARPALAASGSRLSPLRSSAAPGRIPGVLTVSEAARRARPVPSLARATCA